MGHVGFLDWNRFVCLYFPVDCRALFQFYRLVHFRCLGCGKCGIDFEIVRGIVCGTIAQSTRHDFNLLVLYLDWYVEPLLWCLLPCLVFLFFLLLLIFPCFTATVMFWFKLLPLVAALVLCGLGMCCHEHSHAETQPQFCACFHVNLSPLFVLL